MVFWKQALYSLIIVMGVGAGLVFFAPSMMPFGAQLGLSTGNEATARSYGGGRPAPLVALSEVELVTSDNRVKSVGTAQAIARTTLYPETSGRVTELPVVAGQRVEEGDVIARLDDQLQVFAVERAQLSVEDAEAQVERYRTLATSNAVSSVQLNDAQSELVKARLDLSEAQDALRRRLIVAPFSGEIGLIDIGVGDTISTADAVTTLDDRKSLLIEFRVPERFANLISPGNEMSLVSPAIPGQVLKGEVEGMDSRIDATSRTLTIQGRIDNADDLIRPGMSFEVTLYFTGSEYSAVPSLAIQWDSNGPYVWTFEESEATRTDITIISRQADRVLISGDIGVGDRVVSDGTQSVRQGQALRTADSLQTDQQQAPASAVPSVN